VTGPSNEEIVGRYVAAYTAQDWETVGTLRDPDWMMEWPQSGERVRGNANARRSWRTGLVGGRAA
jgi:hypothetical protein